VHLNWTTDHGTPLHRVCMVTSTELTGTNTAQYVTFGVLTVVMMTSH